MNYFRIIYICILNNMFIFYIFIFYIFLNINLNLYFNYKYFQKLIVI